MTPTQALRRHRWLLVVLGVVTPLMLVWTWSNQIGELGSDATDYLVMARHYSPFQPPSAIDGQSAALSRFPPVYPLLLAWLGGAGNLHLAHLITTSLFLAALVVLYAWLLLAGLPSPAAALLVLLFATLPDSWIAGLLIHSEYAYLLLSLAAIFHLNRCHDRGNGGDLLVAALAATLAALTRTIGVVLLVPLAVEAIRSGKRQGLFALLIFVAPLLVWHGLHRAHQSYGRALWSIYGHDPLPGLQSQIRIQFDAYRAALSDDFAGAVLPARTGTLLGFCGCMALAWRACRLRPDALYFLAYAAVLLIWPYPEVARRLLWPVLPLLIAAPLLLMSELATGPWRKPLITAGCAGWAAAILLPALPGLALASDRFRSGGGDWGLSGASQFEGWYNPDLHHAVHRVSSQLLTIEALQAIPKFVPENDCVIAARPVIVTYFARRRAVFPPLNSVPDPLFMQALHASGCHYVFMYSAADGHFPVPLHPLQRLPRPVRIIDEYRRKDPEGEMVCLLVRID